MLNFLCGYRKGYTTQNALVSIKEKWKQIKRDAGAITMDLSKTFDTINHELLLAKCYLIKFLASIHS